MKRGGLVHSFQLAPPLWNRPSQALADTGPVSSTGHTDVQSCSG